MNVLVSGIAGDIGFGIARILREWGLFARLFGMDLHDEHPGNFVFDECTIAPPARDARYLDWLADYITKNRIAVFIPSSEAELAVLASAGVRELCGARIVRNADFTIQKSLDKNDCLAYLETCKVEVPVHGLVGASMPQVYPVIVKPRLGRGSKGVRLATTQVEFETCDGGWVWQEYLASEEQEYTCPVYASPSTGTRILVLKRKLVGGLTGSGVVVQSPEIEDYVARIAAAMRLNGAMNVQLRLTARGPLLFEINPRLSSTLVFRDKMGFSDLRWWIGDTLGMAPPEYRAPKPGMRFFRGAQEYIQEGP